jgi:hypothetical protein
LWRYIVVQAQFERVLRDARDAISRADLNVAVGIGAGIGGTMLGEGRLKSGVDVTVSCSQGKIPQSRAGGQLHALAPRLADIGEESRIAGTRIAADECNVVSSWR